MRFLVDANLPRSTLSLLSRLGHRADHVRDIGLGAAPDMEVAAMAMTLKATLLTRDLDFSDIRLYPPSEYEGIIIMRLPEDAVATAIVKVLERFLSHADILTRLSGRLIILEPDRFRVRPPLD